MRQINPGLLGRWLTGQPLSGDIDGTNRVFTTLRLFLHTTDFKEAVYLRGVRRLEGLSADYVAAESGGPGSGYDTIVFTLAPRVGDILQIDYYPAGP